MERFWFLTNEFFDFNEYKKFNKNSNKIIQRNKDEIPP